MRALAIVACLLLPACVGTRGAPFVSIINVQPPPDDDEVAVRRAAPPRYPRR